MKFIRVLKSYVEDRSQKNDYNYEISRKYIIKFPDYSFDSEEGEWEQKIMQEKQTCKDIITSEFLEIYDSSKKTYELEYVITTQWDKKDDSYLGLITLNKYKDGDVVISGNYSTSRQTRYFNAHQIDSENELALYIDKFLTLIIKHATEYREY